MNFNFFFLNISIQFLKYFPNLISYIYISKKLSIIKLFFLNFSNSFFFFNSNKYMIFFNFLLRSSFFRFKSCTDISVIDFLSFHNRFTFYYNFLSSSLNSRILIFVNLYNLIRINSISSFFLAANWVEREIYDMFGIYFIAHPNLKRILSDYGFSDFPLRKKFPSYGVEEIYFSPYYSRIRYSVIQ